MVLIDAHTHLRTGKLSGTPTPPSAAVALQLLEEDMEQAEIDTSLVVTWPEDIPVLARAAARTPGRLYSLLWFDSRQPESSLQELAALVEQFPAVLIGVKTVFPYLYQSPLQREFLPLYTFCQEHNCRSNSILVETPGWRRHAIRLSLPPWHAPFHICRLSASTGVAAGGETCQCSLQPAQMSTWRSKGYSYTKLNSISRRRFCLTSSTARGRARSCLAATVSCVKKNTFVVSRW